MKILNISPVIPELWNFGGSVVTTFELARELVRQDQQVFYLTTAARRNSQKNLPVSQELDYYGVPTRCCKMWGPAPPFWSPELRRQVRRRAPEHDIAIIRSCWTYVGVAASRECRRAGLPYLAYPEGSLDPWTMRYGSFKKRLFWHLGERAYFQGAGAIIALAKAEREHIRSRGLTNRIEVIPNGIHLSDLECAESRKEIEDHWSELNGRPWLLFLGRLHPKKGLDLLLPAFARVAPNFPDHVLVIAGPDEGGYARTVQRMALDSGIADKILLTGPVYGKAKVGLLREADLFALTSYSEGLPMAVLEALGCGIPALLTEACNVPEVESEGAGLVASPTVEAVSQALGELLRDGQMRKEMGRKARELVLSRFTWDKVAQKTTALCEELLSKS